ncbi:MAG TPA: cysteine desulfurase family protein, partial [Thermoanaerobaculia bacterium]|nr:cysteine desulfurase family protein [Thermoanaerobaculia bacterium]
MLTGPMGAYFDHNATTPLDPRVREAMLPWLGERFGNPSSIHRWGREAREAVERAREEVAGLLGARAGEIVFAASGTEANNTVLQTVARRAGFRGHLVISALEHPSIRRGAELLEAAGMAVVRVPPAPDGVVDPGAVVAALRPDTRLVALMRANNEIGTLQPVAEVAAACRERGVPVLADAVQAAGKIAVDVAALGASWVTIGGHKLHGPVGAAALWVDPAAALDPLLVGGSQERRRRASTENVAGIVGLGRAAALAAAELPARERRL